MGFSNEGRGTKEKKKKLTIINPKGSREHGFGIGPHEGRYSGKQNSNNSNGDEDVSISIWAIEICFDAWRRGNWVRPCIVEFD